MRHYETTSSEHVEEPTQRQLAVPATSENQPPAQTPSQSATVLDLRLKSTKSDQSTSVEVSNDLIDLVEKIITGVKGLFK